MLYFIVTFFRNLLFTSYHFQQIASHTSQSAMNLCEFLVCGCQKSWNCHVLISLGLKEVFYSQIELIVIVRVKFGEKNRFRN